MRAVISMLLTTYWLNLVIAALVVFFVFGFLKVMQKRSGGKKAALDQAQPATATETVATVTVPPFATHDFIAALGARKTVQKEAPAHTAAQPEEVVSGPRLIDRLKGNSAGLRKVGKIGFAALVLYAVISGIDGSNRIPTDASLTAGDAPEVAAMASDVVDKMDVQEREMAAVVTVSAASFAPTSAVVEQFGNAGLRAESAYWLAKVKELGKTQFSVGGKLMPLWGFAMIVVGLMLLALAVASRLIDTKSVKSTQIDPFERLLKRRLAEKAREDQAAIVGGRALRA